MCDTAGTTDNEVAGSEQVGALGDDSYASRKRGVLRSSARAAPIVAAPRFLRSAPTTHTGLAIEDGRATCLCGWSSEPVVTMAAALDAYNEHADG